MRNLSIASALAAMAVSHGTMPRMAAIPKPIPYGNKPTGAIKARRLARKRRNIAKRRGI